jgi:hypothetical protein
VIDTTYVWVGLGLLIVVIVAYFISTNLQAPTGAATASGPNATNEGTLPASSISTITAGAPSSSAVATAVAFRNITQDTLNTFSATHRFGGT